LKVVFFDEKLITIEHAHNTQNDGVLTLNSAERNKRGRAVFRIQKPKSMMVWAGVTATGKLSLVFVKNGVKINSINCVDNIIGPVVLPWIQTNVEDGPWIFKQDLASPHRARTTQEWISENCGNFITARECPPYSPDCDPLDYSIWEILDSKACASAHISKELLKNALRWEWDRISLDKMRAGGSIFRSVSVLVLKQVATISEIFFCNMFIGL
jgi:hypothetical protein